MAPAPGGPRSRTNPNVLKAYLFTLFGGAARGVWSFSVLSGYLYALSGESNWSVGLAEGIQGGAQAAVAIFAGVLADHWRRDRTLMLAGIVGLFAVGVTILAVNTYALTTSDDVQYVSICIALSLWGSYQGLWNTGVETIFADSIKPNQRSKPTTNKYILQLISTVTGPMIAIFLFLGFGDSWQIYELRVVMMVGAGLCAPPALLLFMFSDADMVSHRRRMSSVAQPGISENGTHYNRIDSSADDREELVYPARESDEKGKSKNVPVAGEEESANFKYNTNTSTNNRKYNNLGNYNNYNDNNNTIAKRRDIGRPHTPDNIDAMDSINGPYLEVLRDESPHLPTPSLFPSPPQSPRDRRVSTSHRISVGGDMEDAGLIPAAMGTVTSEYADDVLDNSDAAKRVPYVTIIADIISGFGSGMTIKFFPLFFKNELGLSPIHVNAIYVGLPIAMALGSQAAQVLRRRIGRAQTCIVYGYIGAAALAVMGQLSHYKSLYVWQILVPIYFLSSAQHCTRPLKKSILMDYVPKKTRARWNSIDSITRFGWSGSAVVGGYLVDRYSYTVTFTLTAIMQVIASSLFFLLVTIVKIEPPRPKHNHGTANATDSEQALEEEKHGNGTTAFTTGSATSPNPNQMMNPPVQDQEEEEV